MTKDDAIHKALKVLNCLNNDRIYETAWVKDAINACEEALEQPEPFISFSQREWMNQLAHSFSAGYEEGKKS